MGKPNIVLITCHDLGRHINTYGVSTVSTPFMNKIARDGLKFNNIFCTSPGCSPSRASLATGRYPHSNGVMGLAHADFGWDLKKDEEHIATILENEGYETILFGLQHITYKPERLGFKKIYNDPPSYETLKKVISEATKKTGEALEKEVSLWKGPPSEADNVIKNITDFLERYDYDKPFYFEINFFEPHRPFNYGGVKPYDLDGVFVPGYIPDIKECREELSAFQGAIQKVDDSVGQIQNLLENAGVLDETLLIFTTDHGIAFPRAKGTLYDPGIEIVLLMRWPLGGLTGGKTYDHLISNIDILPTILDIIRIEKNNKIQGKSFNNLIQGKNYKPRKYIYAEKTNHCLYDPIRCVKTKDHKLILNFENNAEPEVPSDITEGETYKAMVNSLRNTRQRLELYDLKKDRWEKNNVISDQEYSKIKVKLLKKLISWMEKTKDPLLQAPIPSPHYMKTLEFIRTIKDI